jgi:hypothetical protein
MKSTLALKRDYSGPVQPKDVQTAIQAILAKFPQDGPAKLYLERCDTLSKNPPPEGWDGVYTMTTK